MPLTSATPISAGEKGVFAEGVIAAAELQVAVDVHKGLKRDVDAQRAVFAADHHSVFFGQFAAEGGGHAHGGGLTLRRMARQHSRRPIGKAKPWNAKARDAAQIPGLPLVDSGVLVRAVDQRQFLFAASSG